MSFDQAESKAGLIGGTFLGAVVNIPEEDFMHTIILAGVGAMASFVATLVCKAIATTFKKHWQKRKLK